MLAATTGLPFSSFIEPATFVCANKEVLKQTNVIAKNDLITVFQNKRKVVYFINLI
jgi:hypothetical protein